MSAEFLDQFEQARRSVASWPKWMRDAARYAVASFPVPKPEQRAASQDEQQEKQG